MRVSNELKIHALWEAMETVSSEDFSYSSVLELYRDCVCLARWERMLACGPGHTDDELWKELLEDVDAWYNAAVQEIASWAALPSLKYGDPDLFCRQNAQTNFYCRLKCFGDDPLVKSLRETGLMLRKVLHYLKRFSRAEGSKERMEFRAVYECLLEEFQRHAGITRSDEAEYKVRIMNHHLPVPADVPDPVEVDSGGYLAINY